MNGLPPVSVGLPVYNGEAFLREALDSILNQTLSDFELIISDNASTDRTEEICRAYVKKDSRIRYFRNEKNIGAAGNYNQAFHASRGQYFKWAAHDDVCAPEFLERCVAVLESDRSAVLCYPATTIIDEKGNPLRRYEDEIEYLELAAPARFRSWIFRRPGGECNAVFGVLRSSALKQTGLIGKYMASDVILLGEMVLRGKVHKLPECLFFRRDHPNTSGRAQRSAEEILVWFDTSKKGRVHLPRWRWFSEYTRAILRVPISLPDKVRCFAIAARSFIMARKQLRKELVGAVKKTLGRQVSTS